MSRPRSKTAAPHSAPNEGVSDGVSARDSGQRLGFLGVLREMLWAFFGVRTHERYRLATQSNPLHIILAGIVVTAGVVTVLVVIVRFALGWAGAA